MNVLLSYDETIEGYTWALGRVQRIVTEIDLQVVLATDADGSF
jgi:hypothetical protein